MQHHFKGLSSRPSTGTATLPDAVALSTCLRSLILAGLLAVLLGSGVGSAIARESDRSQPIDVRADRSEFDEKAGIQTLTGNVVITQGTMKITADSIVISLRNNALSKIVGNGSPIRFEQQNEEGDLMQGEARQIVYDAIAGTLTLKGSASLKQPRQNLVSDEITFDSRTQKVSATGGGDSGRVSIQLQAPEGSR